MDSDWQEVLNSRLLYPRPWSDFLLFQESKGQFQPYYLNRSGLCPKCPFTPRLTSLHYKARQIQLSPPNLYHNGHIIATIAFDPYQELLWVGDDYVSLSAH